MTRPNRVLPTGDIVAAAWRGGLMGNRGILHGADGRLGSARWRHRAWICCRLDWKGRRRAVMAPGCYTELFFPDEAVALAAGHRPCAACRREDYERFRDAFVRVYAGGPGAPAIDAVLHASRAVRGGRRLRRHRAEAAALPDGAFVMMGDRAARVWGTEARPFGPEGYERPVPRPVGEVEVLTSAAMLRVMRAGYRPAPTPR